MWGKLENGSLKKSKSYLIWNGRKYWNAPEQMWLAAGWKHVIYGEYPEEAEEVTIEYTEDETNIYVTYEGVEQNESE